MSNHLERETADAGCSGFSDQGLKPSQLKPAASMAFNGYAFNKHRQPLEREFSAEGDAWSLGPSGLAVPLC